MKNQDLFELFCNELQEMYNSENRIIEALPKLIKSASLSDLKEALKKHLHETENQLARLQKIFAEIDVTPVERPCTAIEGLINSAEEIIGNFKHSPTLDAAIICETQKVEHYEIASYGTLRSFAKYLNLRSDIVDLLQETLDEEAAADKKLTKIAEGSFFFNGVNKEAVAGNGAKTRKAS